MTDGKFYCGLEVNCVPDLCESLESAVQEKFDFLVAPLVHPRLRRDSVGVSDSRAAAFTRSDLVLDSGQWSTSVVGKVSPWINLDSPSERVRETSVKVFKQEVAWATHLSVPAVLLPTPALNCNNYARCLNQVILQLNFLQAWVRVPLVSAAAMLGLDSESSPADGGDGESKEEGGESAPLAADDPRDPWCAWNRLRQLCEAHSNVSVALEVTADLPSEAEIDRWMGEPIKAAIVPTSVFLTNKKGFPCLSRAHQALIHRLHKQKVQLVVRGRSHHPNGMLPYLQYLYHLYNKTPALSQQEDFEAPYLDYLQAPLQPLMDNLESATYETFEKDPIKYRQYEEAIRQALADTPAEKTTVLMVVGAGRGPLVRAALRAAGSAARRLRVYAVEKNPNAVVTLRNMKATHGWGDSVTVVATDMRVWRAPEKADILVSELLGSFGDNELSPECLLGAQRFLKPEGGISIPYNYTSFVAPITTSKLWNEVKNYDELKNFETAYVVKFHNFSQLDDAKPCFYFEHPDHGKAVPPVVAAADEAAAEAARAAGTPVPSRAPDLSRYTRLVFTSKADAMLHGLAGYFESMLYKDVDISINPATFSEGMFSWFPIYFPIRTPIRVRKGETVEVHFWRCCNSAKVWYEWCIARPDVSPIHNPNGRSYWIGL